MGTYKGLGSAKIPAARAIVKKEGFLKRKPIIVQWKAGKNQVPADIFNADTELNSKILKISGTPQYDILLIRQNAERKYFEIYFSSASRLSVKGTIFPTYTLLEVLDRVAGHIAKLHPETRMSSESVGGLGRVSNSNVKSAQRLVLASFIVMPLYSAYAFQPLIRPQFTHLPIYHVKRNGHRILTLHIKLYR